MSDVHDFLAFVAHLFRLQVSDVSLATQYGQVPWDSVMHLRLIMELEAHYGVTFPFSEIPQLQSLDAIFKALVTLKAWEKGANATP